MGGGASTWTDARVELAVSRILRARLLLTAVLFLAGSALHLARHRTEIPQCRVFTGGLASPRAAPASRATQSPEVAWA